MTHDLRTRFSVCAALPAGADLLKICGISIGSHREQYDTDRCILLR